MKKYRLSLHIFRRDLRVHDNTALIQALTLSDEVIPCFIFDPRQVGDKNEYRSTNAMQFMIEALQELDKELREHKAHLYVGYGIAEEVVEQILTELPVEAVFLNADYTPFSCKRDQSIEKMCHAHKRDFVALHDSLLLNPTTFLNKQGEPYAVFTPFYKAGLQYPIAQPVKNNSSHYYRKPISLLAYDIAKELTPRATFLTTSNPHLVVHGTAKGVKKLITDLSNYGDYQKTRDIPSMHTTHLSAVNKFGVVSVRALWHAIVNNFGLQHPLLRQWYWRDFFTHHAYHFPRVFGHAYRQAFDKIEWHNDKHVFKRWCEGKTGFPLVDAGMRELNTSGYMHNRVRMVVASFLVKDLHIDWRWGERYFAQQLVDYDPAVNNGNWQWSASTGTDPQPYFRIFNPWLQQKRFDPDCEYVKKWVPELKKYSPDLIHKHFQEQLSGYIEPMVDHAVETKKALMTYKKCLS